MLTKQRNSLIKKKLNMTAGPKLVETAEKGCRQFECF